MQDSILKTLPPGQEDFVLSEPYAQSICHEMLGHWTYHMDVFTSIAYEQVVLALVACYRMVWTVHVPLFLVPNGRFDARGLPRRVETVVGALST
jgi:hypothetical protein